MVQEALQTITNVSGNEAYLVDVEAEAPLDATTLLSGLATAIYSYNSAPGFECCGNDMGRPSHATALCLFDLPSMSVAMATHWHSMPIWSRVPQA